MKLPLLQIAISILLIMSVSSRTQPYSISGYVTDGSDPLFYANVRVQATKIFTRTDFDGRFTLTGITSLDTLHICAGVRGYYNGDTRAVAGDTGIVITLNPLPTEDNPDYQWISHEPDSADAMRCGNCHTSTMINQWQNNAHAKSATNPFFLAMYYGTDIDGTPGVSDSDIRLITRIPAEIVQPAIFPVLRQMIPSILIPKVSAV
jgi:hypothetical protein